MVGPEAGVESVRKELSPSSRPRGARSDGVGQRARPSRARPDDAGVMWGRTGADRGGPEAVPGVDALGRAPDSALGRHRCPAADLGWVDPKEAPSHRAAIVGCAPQGDGGTPSKLSWHRPFSVEQRFQSQAVLIAAEGEEPKVPNVRAPEPPSGHAATSRGEPSQPRAVNEGLLTQELSPTAYAPVSSAFSDDARMVQTGCDRFSTSWTATSMSWSAKE